MKVKENKNRIIVRNTNKTQLVLEHLKTYGSINSIEAIELYGATRLSSIIFNLRKHYCIRSVDSIVTDKYGNTEKYTKYVYLPSTEN